LFLLYINDTADNLGNLAWLTTLHLHTLSKILI
jgi:hypothetical protein